MRSPLATSPDFRLFFTGQLVSLLGTSMAPVALAFAVLDATHSPSQLGVVLTARMVPMLAFLLIGGATADRFSRRTVLIVANLGAALTQGGVAVLLLSGHFNLAGVAVLEFGNGTLDAFTIPALRGLLPQLVDAPRLRQANSLLSSTRNATKILGPSVSGLLVVGLGSGAAIALDAASFAIAAVCLSRLSRTLTAMPRRETALRSDLREGWTLFRGIPWVWVVTLACFFINLLTTGTWQILGPSLTQQLSSTATWGFVLSARGAGLLVMSALLYRLRVRHLLRLGQLMCALGALPLLALGAHAGAPVLIGAAFVAGLGSSVYAISWDTSLQEHVPTGAIARISSYSDLLSYLAIPVGQLSVGPLAAAVGGFTVAGFAGVGYLIAGTVPLASRSVRRLVHAGHEEELVS